MTAIGGRASARPPIATPVGMLPPPPVLTAEVAPCSVADLPHVYGMAMGAFGALRGRSRRSVVETLLHDVVFVARRGGRPVGYVALGRTPQDVLVVDQLLVAPGYEPSGVGDLLLLEAEEWGGTEHARALRVVVDESDWTARGFYRLQGFVLVDRAVLELPLSP